jgi:hypothetical protein
MGMVRLGNLSTDGTKMGANASRHKAMSYGHMAKKIEQLQAEIDALLARAEQVDAAQDAALGSRRGDELPAELQRRQDRLKKIQEAKERLEAEGRAQAKEKERRRDAERAERIAAGHKPRGPKPQPIDPTPEDRTQMNFTDPDAQLMKQSNKGLNYSYNAQATVDAANQIIVAAETTSAACDQEQAVPMARAALDNLKAAGIALPSGPDGTVLPIPNTADGGYFSAAAVEGLELLNIDPYIAPGRPKGGAKEPAAQTAAATAAALARAKMQEKLQTAAGKALYAARKQIVEPVFGMTKSVRGIHRFLVRGAEKVSGEWQLICLTHNLLKIWRYGKGVAAPSGG